MDDLSIAFKLNDQVFLFWQFYVSAVAILIGWVFSRKDAWSKQKALTIGFSIIIFNIFNISGLLLTTKNLNSIITFMKCDGYKVQGNISKAVLDAAIQRLTIGDWYFHVGFHLISDVIVAYFVFVVARQIPR